MTTRKSCPEFPEGFKDNSHTMWAYCCTVRQFSLQLSPFGFRFLLVAEVARPCCMCKDVCWHVG